MYRMKRRHAPPEKTGMKTSRGHSFAAYLQHALLIPQMWSAFPRNLCTSAHIRGQVLTLEGQTCSLRRTFTMYASWRVRSFFSHHLQAEVMCLVRSYIIWINLQ